MVNQAENRRREKRQLEVRRVARKSGRKVSSLLLSLRRASQRSVKFIRWLRGGMKSGATVEQAVPILMASYATL